MKLTCPNCQETLSLAALIEHVAAREAFVLALEIAPPLAKPILQYTNLFKPAQRSLSMDRFASILNELLPMIKAAQIERNGRAWAAPTNYWQQAFETMWTSRDKLTLPLKSHGYLLEIIAGYSNKAEAKAEKTTEKGRQYGDFHTADADKKSVALPKAKEVEASKQADHSSAIHVESSKVIMPDDVRKTIRKMTGRKDG